MFPIKITFCARILLPVCCLLWQRFVAMFAHNIFELYKVNTNAFSTFNKCFPVLTVSGITMASKRVVLTIEERQEIIKDGASEISKMFMVNIYIYILFISTRINKV